MEGPLKYVSDIVVRLVVRHKFVGFHSWDFMYAYCVMAVDSCGRTSRRWAGLVVIIWSGDRTDGQRQVHR